MDKLFVMVAVLILGAMCGVADATILRQGDSDKGGERPIREGSLLEGGDSDEVRRESVEDEHEEQTVHALDKADQSFEMEVEDAFRDADGDGNGSLDAVEAKKLMINLNAPAEEWHDADTNRDGALSQSEFRVYAKKQMQGPDEEDERDDAPSSFLEDEAEVVENAEGEDDEAEEEATDTGVSLAEVDEESEDDSEEEEEEEEDEEDEEVSDEQVTEEFHEYDGNQDGFLEGKEVESYITETEGPEFRWQPYDTDKDGRMSLAEAVSLAKTVLQGDAQAEHESKA